jgi:uncharacterized protein YcfJ
MNKLLAASVASALALASGAALARPHGDVANVISATPVYQRVANPAPQCWNEQVTAYENRRVAPAVPAYAEPHSGVGPGTVLGAIVGGVIGHQFGGSSAGRDHGSVAGALIGGLVGNDIDRTNGGYYRRASQEEAYVERVPVSRTVQRCEPSPPRDEVVGYDVRYEYHGVEYFARLPYNPGPTLPVNVEVRPAAEGPVRPSYSY